MTPLAMIGTMMLLLMWRSIAINFPEGEKMFAVTVIVLGAFVLTGYLCTLWVDHKKWLSEEKRRSLK